MVQPSVKNTESRSTSLQAPVYRPVRAEFPGAEAKLEKVSRISSTTGHIVALQRIAELVSGTKAGDLVQSFRDRQTRLRADKDQRQANEIFEESRKILMAPDRWTYGNMAAYQMKLLDLMGAYGWRRRLSQDDPNIQRLEKELKVLEAMTPVELASNHKSVFSREAIKLIGEKSGTSEKFVNEVIMEHDILRGDRRWYKILEQFKRPLPKNFDDRQHMAEYDRPFSETERQIRQDMIDRETRITTERRIKPKRMKSIYFRQPSCGGNRWSTRAPRWYPVRFKMRPERVKRMAGVGVPGGGGDRGQPRGRLAAHGFGR